MFNVIHMKYQALFSSKDKSKKIKCRLLQFLFSALRVNHANFTFLLIAEFKIPVMALKNRTKYDGFSFSTRLYLSLESEASRLIFITGV